MAKFAAGFGLTQRLKPSSHLGEEAVTGPFGFPDTRSSNGFNGFYVPRHRYHVPREARVTPNFAFWEKIEQFHVSEREIFDINVNIAEI